MKQIIGRYARSQKDLILEVLKDAKERNVWLTLYELAHLTNICETSVSAQLRRLRKEGYDIEKRIYSGMVREYRIGKRNPTARADG